MMRDLPLNVTLWRRFSRGRLDRHTWRSFLDTFIQDPEVVRDKKSVAGFSLASFEGNRRALSRVEQVYGLVLDLDHGTPTIEAVTEAFGRTLGVVYTTFSHTPEAPRLRAIFPHTRPLTVEEHDRIWVWAKKRCEKVGLELDASARDASHLFFLPSHPPGAEYRFDEITGKPIDVDKALREKWLKDLSAEEIRQIASPSVAVPSQGPTLDLQGTAMRGVDTSASGRDWHLALRLMRSGLTDDEVAAQLRAQSRKYAQRGESYVLYTVSRAREVHESCAPLMRVRRASLHRLPGRFSYPERRHVELELRSDDGEVATARIVVPAPWYSDRVEVTWRSCFPDVEPETLLGPWDEIGSIWRQIRWRRRVFEVAVRGSEIRWIRAADCRLI